jgi:NDP-sugar pyrophosphorylase family protein
MSSEYKEISPFILDVVEKSKKKFFQQLSKERIFPDRIGIILAAGAATRFRPLTASKIHADRGELEDKDHYSVIPWNKASLPVANRPLIDYTIEDMVASGFYYIIINVSKLHAADSVIKATQASQRFGKDVCVTFLIEDQPSGTYGGVMKMLHSINSTVAIPPDVDIGIFSGDIYTEQPGYEILRFHREKSSAFTLMLNRVPDEMKNQFGTVELDDDSRIIAFHEKKPDAPTNLNNSSRYIAKYGLLNRWAGEITPVPPDKKLHKEAAYFFDFGLHVFDRHFKEIRDAGFYGYISNKEWADIGRIYDFREINVQILNNKVMCRVHPKAKIKNKSSLLGNYSITNRSIVRNRAVVKDSAIGEGWTIDGATLTRTVLMPLPDGVTYTIARGVTLTNCVIGCGDINTSYENKVIVSNGTNLIVKEI